jgi:hypothetical protein
MVGTKTFAAFCAAWLACLAGVAACDDDSSTPGSLGKTDAGSFDVARPDSATYVPPSDAGDSGTADGSGPKVTVTTGSTGFIEMLDFLAQGAFYEDDTIIRAPDVPACVVHVRSSSKLRSAAGTVTIGGESVGKDGGPPEAITINPELQEGYAYTYFGTVYPAGADTTVQVSMSAGASLAFPSLPVQTLRTSPAAFTTITAPVKPDAGKLKIDSTKAFTVTWTVPAGAGTGHTLNIDVTQLANDDGGFRFGDVRCAFPLAAGTASVPAYLLSELKARLGGPATGFTAISTGGQKEVATGIASYVLRVKSSTPTTSFDSEGSVDTVLE